MVKEIGPDDYDTYFGKGTKDKNILKQKRALKYALDIRKFEINLYWKRATYFWAFIAASFVAYSALQQTKNAENSYLSFIVSCLGLVFSFAWFFVNKGSKQWQENWENHVDLLEDEIIGQLYKVVLSRPNPNNIKDKIKQLVIGPAPYSVSKINQIVSLFVIAIWAILFFYAIPPILWVDQLLPCLSFSVSVKWGYLITIILVTIACIAILRWGKTDSNDDFEHIATIRKSTVKQPKSNSD